MSSRLNYLLERYISKTCTESEKQELAHLALDAAHEEDIRLHLEGLYNSLEPLDDIPEQKSESILHSILQPVQRHSIENAGAGTSITEASTSGSGISGSNKAGSDTNESGINESGRAGAGLKYLYTRRFASIAAAVIVLISAVAFYLFNQQNKGKYRLNNFANARQDIKAPDTNKAMIVLGNGKRVLLDSMQKQSLALQGNVQVIRTSDGQIQYKGNSGELVYNTLVNPRGSRVINLTLQDGTRVWLNCESSLKYPISFEDKDRIVEVKGEAYFEVAKNPSKRFMVVANGVKTEVIGTHFNVNGYNDYGHVNITLLEGSIRISNSSSSAILKPGQEAKLNEAGKIDIDKDIETDEIIAWKDGMFNFNSVPLPGIMKQIERWYDVDVVYDGSNSEKHFSGIFSRADNVSEILKMMQLAGIKFTIQGKKIIVTE
jgi:transmembrane sensor